MFSASHTETRMISRYATLFAALFLIAASASAQGALTATPNPYDGSAGVPLVLRNGTAAPVTLDSLRFASTLPGSTSDFFGAWLMFYDGTVGGLAARGSVVCYRSAGETCYNDGLFGRAFAPSDELAFTITVDLPVRPGAARSAGGFSDTLFVYTDGSTTPLSVVIDDVFFVASEAPPEARTVRLDAAPNPARDASTLTLTRASAGEARVVAYDGLGREVAVLHDGPAPEALSLHIDTSAWPVGAYVVRASAGGETATARLVVVR